MSLLSFNDVTFTYPGDASPTVKNLSFSIEEGEFVCLIGPSGCGKSTIFRLVNKLLTPDSGSIDIGGNNISVLKNYCGYMPQHDLLFPWRSVADNIRLPLEIKGGISRPDMDKSVADVLKTVGLENWGGKSPSELSGGMRQRAAFARTLLTGCELLLLDEPFSALDYLTRLSLREWLLSQWQREHKTILFITHDVEEAVFLSNRILAVCEYPITRLVSVDIPSGYPRTIESLAKPDMESTKAKLIGMLRKEPS